MIDKIDKPYGYENDHTPRFDELAKVEQEKYRFMWKQPIYRQNSPGENIAETAFNMLGAQPSHTIIDFGCGEGQAMDFFRSRGLIPRGVDIVAQRPDVMEACLWDLPAHLPVADYGFCADVMEHIPPGKVDDVVGGIRSRVRYRAFFQIANCDCTVGKRFGYDLHLTKEKPDWWVGMIRQYFQHVELHPDPFGKTWRFMILASAGRGADPEAVGDAK